MARRLHDAGWKSKDLTRLYYDGHNYVKFGFTMAFTTTVLAWGAVSWPEAFNIAKQLNEIRKTIKWATDYFISLLYEVSRSDPASETAATLAASSIVFKGIDSEYSTKCVKHARELYVLANHYRGFYHEAIQKFIKNAQQFYNNTDYGDELAWAAIWLHKAEPHFDYLNDAENHYQNFHLEKRPNEFSYNNKIAVVQMLLAQLTGKLGYQKAVRDFCDFSVHQQTCTPKGLLYIDKLGTLSDATNIAFICLEAAEYGIGPSHQYDKFAKEQIAYMLDKTGRSYVVSRINSPQQLHHIASSCPDKHKFCGLQEFNQTISNPQVLYGASFWT